MSENDALSLYRYAKSKLSDLAESDIESKLIVSYVLDISINDIYINKGRKITDQDIESVDTFINQRLKGQPIQYVLGQTEFFGYTFFCDKNVLIPRSETELLCEIALQLIKSDMNVLDLCTGSGCIGITLKKQKQNLDITCSDISKKALEMAKKNAEHNCVDVNFIQSDLFDNVDNSFDIIVSNPPYINQHDYDNLDKKVLDFEPKLALLGGYDGLDLIEKIIKDSVEKLNPNGHLLLEIGFDQGEIVSSLFEKMGYKQIKVFSDYNDFDRIVIGTKE